MYKLFTAFIVLFIVYSGLRSQNTTITGNVPGAEGLKIRLISPSDYISELSKKIDETTIDELGNFNLKTSINECIFAQIQIDIYKGEIYLEPGKTYSINILPLNFKDENKETPFLNRTKLDIVFNNKDTNELNQQIGKFNILYNDFIISNSAKLLRNRNKAIIDSFRIKSFALFSPSKNSFLNNYIKYRIAGLEQSGRIKSTANLYSAYILNQAVLYNHIEYMYFFNEFYEKFLFNGKHSLKTEDLKRFIDKERNYSGLLDSLGRDSLVKNEVIRELVFLKGMKEIYYTNAYNKDNIIYLLTKFSLKTKFKEHKQIAINLITSFNTLKIGNKAPDFNFKSMKGDIFSLSSFQGKYTYLGFFTTWCTACVAENELIAELKKKFGDKINFVSISTDKQVLNLNYYLEKHKYDWYFLHYGNNNEILEKYEILTYPVFILLDANGAILNYPALKPSENIENEFKNLLNTENSSPNE